MSSTFRLMRLVITLMLFGPSICFGQHRGFSYELLNEVGTYRLVSLTYSHKLDNTEGITFVIDKQRGDTIYRMDKFLHGFVGLSRDGQTVAHLISEENGKALTESRLEFFRGGKGFDEAKLSKLISYQLEEAEKLNRLPKSGWLKNDSILHRMASNPFYVSEDKLFVSFEGPTLMVFDMNQMFHIYTGNGANHFFQNYYAIPSAPYRTTFDWGEYIPTGFPETLQEKEFNIVLSKALDSESAIPEDAKYRVEIELKLNRYGQTDIRKAQVFSIKSNDVDGKLSDKLAKALEGLTLSTSLLPPDHPAWIFAENFWLK